MTSANKTESRVQVKLTERSYDIVISDTGVSCAGHYLTPHLHSPQVAVITDETVMTLHGAALRASLEVAHINPHFIVRPAGEAQKNFTALQDILNILLDLDFTRQDTIIGFGGGVIGDLSGLAASLYKRGCGFVQIPTTLLAQVDSSVGGKTAINVTQGKNLIGTFYQPQLVITDTSLLKSLPEREMKAGYAEVMKYGLLGDAGFFNWLENHSPELLACQPEACAYAIKICCENKAQIVSADEREHGQRALLNLGHSFAHALEAEAGYDGRLLHGEAVSAGLLMAFEFSRLQGLCPEEAVTRLHTHLARMHMPTANDISPWLIQPENLLEHMHQDKKNQADTFTLILVRAIGDAFVQKNVSPHTLLNFWKTQKTTYHHA